MRVTMKKAMAGPTGSAGVGQAVEVSDAEARELIAGGYAEAAGATVSLSLTVPPELIETTVAKAVEAIKPAPAATSKAEQAKAKREAAAAKAKADKQAAEAAAPTPE